MIFNDYQRLLIHQHPVTMPFTLSELESAWLPLHAAVPTRLPSGAIAAVKTGIAVAELDDAAISEAGFP